MCGIGGAHTLGKGEIPQLTKKLEVLNKLQTHRGPDGSGIWTNKDNSVGFAHRRLSIIDVENGSQPMSHPSGNCVTYNGEIYNYIELREELGAGWNFSTGSDTEVLLESYNKWGIDCLSRFRGMFSFALWDEREDTLVCARDFVGIKPFYYTVVDGVFYFASEIKALLPFLPSIETDPEGLKEYLTFQFCLNDKTLFKGVKQLPPGHYLTLRNGSITVKKYWEVYYHIDSHHTSKYFEEKLTDLLDTSIKLHLRSDVPIGSYLSGGLDSSLVASLAASYSDSPLKTFTGRFDLGEKYDESMYAAMVADNHQMDFGLYDLTVDDFLQNIENVIYHLDHPVAGPGSFSQYMISKHASQHRKVILGGQGGDEIFGGYTRYLVAYFEQCIKAAINGTLSNGNFVVTYESIIPNLTSLNNYQPMLKQFWSKGLFEPMDRRYFSLVDRSGALKNNIVRHQELGSYDPYETFREIFHGENVQPQSYLDLMTHFDFKTLLPALLQVEDRVSMAHGLESRVPLLDKEFIEFAATIPADVKFKNGNMKHILQEVGRKILPSQVIDRKNKMGFPTPFSAWSQGALRDYVIDTFTDEAAKNRPYINNANITSYLEGETEFGRGLWGMFSYELWQKKFHDQQHYYKKLLKE